MKSDIPAVSEKIGRVEEIIEALRKCATVDDRYEILHKFIPDAWFLNPLSARALIVWIQKRWGIDFGVCPYYKIKGGKQYCFVDGSLVECLCVIPEPHCVFRDGKVIKKEESKDAEKNWLN